MQEHKPWSREDDALIVCSILDDDLTIREVTSLLGRARETVRRRVYALAEENPRLREVLDERILKAQGNAGLVRLGRPPKNPPAPAKKRPPQIDPLPVGHPLTWGAITRGTCLEGAACV